MKLAPLALAAAALLSAACATQARIVEIQVQSAQPYANGHVFGAAGAYERVTGVALGELDPADARNKGIVNIDKAPKNARGRVAYEVDFDVLRPVDAGLGNGKILYDVTNRGRKFITHWMMDGAPQNANNPLTLADAGNALFFRQGWTMVWTGWDPDAPRSNNGMTIRVPTAVNADGSPIVRVIRDELVSSTRAPAVKEFRLTHEAATTDTTGMRLTVRRREADPRVEVPRDQWRLKDTRTLELLGAANPTGAGPAVGSLYEMHYPAKGPKVLGIGYAATRDVISFLRYGAADVRGPHPANGPKTAALAVGISQSGRYLRDHIAQGFNQDESARKVFDGVLAHISGVGRVFMNAEFGMPARTNTQHEDHTYPENEFPFSAATLDDPLTGKRGALLRGDGFDPLLIETNTSTEYWQKGASLLTTDALGQRDVPLPATARAYLIAGTQHGGRVGLTPAAGPCMNPRNPHSPAPALRALTVALDEWVTRGTPPPTSRVPSFTAGTLVKPDNAGFPAIPGLATARFGNDVVIFGDWVNPKIDPAKRYPAGVSRTDADGNEVAGIRLPDIAVPLATYTGWNLYKAPFTENELCDRDGSYREFAATKADREKANDPRLSLEERYPTHADYTAKVAAAARALVAERLLLAEDAEAAVRQAGSEAVRKRFAR